VTIFLEIVLQAAELIIQKRIWTYRKYGNRLFRFLQKLVTIMYT